MEGQWAVSVVGGLTSSNDVQYVGCVSYINSLVLTTILLLWY